MLNVHVPSVSSAVETATSNIRIAAYAAPERDRSSRSLVAIRRQIDEWLIASITATRSDYRIIKTPTSLDIFVFASMKRERRAVGEVRREEKKESPSIDNEFCDQSVEFAKIIRV